MENSYPAILKYLCFSQGLKVQALKNNVENFILCRIMATLTLQCYKNFHS